MEGSVLIYKGVIALLYCINLYKLNKMIKTHKPVQRRLIMPGMN
jgi:hypothetical protein